MLHRRHKKYIVSNLSMKRKIKLFKNNYGDKEQLQGEVRGDHLILREGGGCHILEINILILETLKILYVLF